MITNLIIIEAYHGIPKEDGTPSQQFARILNINKAKVIRISDGTREEYEIDNSQDAESNESSILN